MNGDTWFNISNGTLGTVSSNHTSTKIEDYGNGWYRLSVTVTAPASPTDNTGQFSWYVANANGETNVTQDGTSTSFWYGGQIEVGEYGTSYIETDTASVTRVAETATGAGNDQVINSTEGVLYVETSALSNDLSERRFGISDGTSANVVRIGYTGVSNRIVAVVYNGSNQAVLTYTSPDITANSKIAVKYKANDFALWVDGVERSTDTSGATFAAGTLNSIAFNVGGVNHFYSKTKEVRVYKTALTDAELAALTT